ncbi:MAG: thiamine phosphate synthase [Desulfobulbaceae bacterium]|jgi:thiamine-phosphate pyrophosphorylase|nr:thiamine phosphate synthase [Desulfobulbaceae bacterium]
MKPTLPVGIYGITAEKFSCGRDNREVARAMLAGGIRIIQYREKRPDKTFAAMLDECLAIRALTREAGALFIVNDYPDLAMLVDADGVHVGQDDFPPDKVRKLIGPDKIIGLSTHGPEQELAARKSGADYIGVGPIFATRTKSDVCAPVGFAYLDYVVKNSPLPFVAIGGIKENNIGQVLAHGAKTVCLVTEIVGAKDIAETALRLRRMTDVF